MDKYLALLLAAMLLVEAVVSRRMDFVLLTLSIVTPPASLLDWVLDVRLLKREKGRGTSFLMENAIAIATFLGMWDLMALEFLWLPSWGKIVTILCAYKFLVVGFSMVLRDRGAPISQLLSATNILSLALRTLTIGLAASAYILALLVVRP